MKNIIHTNGGGSNFLIASSLSLPVLLAGGWTLTLTLSSPLSLSSLLLFDAAETEEKDFGLSKGFGTVFGLTIFPVQISASSFVTGPIRWRYLLLFVD